MPQYETPPTQSCVPGATVELEIQRLAAGGDGVARAADGRVIFVPQTAPGDRVQARIQRVRRRYARAELQSVLAPGPGRCEPRCPVYGHCGGCSWQHLSYTAQCDAKIRIVEDALLRIGGVHLDLPVRLTPSPAPYAYRSRARLACDGSSVGYRHRRSNEVCAVPGCPVLVPRLEARLVELAASSPVAPGDWELVADADAARARPIDPATAAATGADREPVELRVADACLRVSPGVFFQSNAALQANLVRAVCHQAGKGSLALDLYAGAGFFTLPLAAHFERVVAVESNPMAAADLRHNLARAGLGRVEVIQARVEDGLARRAATASGADALVLDPPRAGLASGGVEGVLALAPRRIVYLSCDPATLSRDLAGLLDAGYALEHIEAFDLFPQTPHVEVLTRLGRVRGGSAPGPGTLSPSP